MKKKKRRSYKGKNNPMYGQHRCGKNAPNYKNGKSLKQHYCRCGRKITWQAILCHYCASKIRTQGKNNPNYRGKDCITPLHQLIRTYGIYHQWRFRVFKKDNFTCQYCNKHGGYLEAHHIISFALILKKYNINTIDKALKCTQLWDINNGITLCTKCHKLVHKIKLKNKGVK